MRFLLLAADYDGTLACDGTVDESTMAALDRLRASGRKLALVTGRRLPELREVFPRLDLFDHVVAENGALLYRPPTREETVLCEPPEERFLDLLGQKGVPFAVGRCIVATTQPHETELLAAIQELGIEVQVIFNKGSVMALPSGITKASGLKRALDDLNISPHNAVAVGDAENDHAFLRICECSAAVANALPSLKEHADIVLEEARGAGVAELIDKLLADDLRQVDSKLERHWITIGQPLSEGAPPVRMGRRAGSVLVAGPSASGKSTLVSGILEQLIQHTYQFCLVDPEGDYDDFTEILSFGTAKEPPDTRAALRALEAPERSAVINLLGIPLGDRPGYFSSLLSALEDLRLRSARPHWLVIDEAHHLLPSEGARDSPARQLPTPAILITVHPEHVAKCALESVSVVVAIGKSPMETIRAFCRTVLIPAPAGEDCELAVGEALVWVRASHEPPIRLKTVRSTRERRRHARQYAEGELLPEECFTFRGPDLALNLRAQNLKTFLQLAEGVGDPTWMYHLRNGDYSTWFRQMIKDEELAQVAAEIEQDPILSPGESLERIKEAITSRYTAPA